MEILRAVGHSFPSSAFLMVPLLGLGAFGCGGLIPTSSAPPSPTLPADPTPLERCRVGASSTSPLVTEWPASEKSHLQSLAALGPVAVSYTGCELQIVESCRLTGQYSWQRTTLATDTVEITNADDLYAKLPIGAVSLEGELERTGRLAVRTTVAGQLRLIEGFETGGPGSACSDVTHVVSGISVGAFKLLSGGATSASGGASAGAVGLGGKHESREAVVREAGIPGACSESSEEAPDAQCASPIQVFLSPFAPAETSKDTPSAEARGPAPASRSDEEEARRTGVLVRFPAPESNRERWTLRDYSGTELCVLPCERWVRPNSGHYLQREVVGSSDLFTVKLPDRFAQPPGSHVRAVYRAERGSPLWSSLTFWGMGVPTGILGGVLLGFGIFGKECDPGQSSLDCDEDPFAGTVGIIGGSFYLAFAGGAAYWYFWSHSSKFETELDDGSAALGPRIGLGPRGIVGTF